MHLRRSENSLPLEGGAPRSESKIYMTAGGSHTATKWHANGVTDEGR